MSHKRDGFVFVPTGNVARTRLVKKVEGSEEVFDSVRGYRKRVGFYVPELEYEAIEEQLRATAAKRAKSRKASRKVRRRKEREYKEEFEKQIRQEYPSIPEKAIKKIVKQATKVSSGRVGRTQTIDLSERVRLAVQAHIRHTYTDYEAILKQRNAHYIDKGYPVSKASDLARDDAREAVFDELQILLLGWQADYNW